MAKDPESPGEPSADYSNILQAIATRIREARLNAKLTPSELALKAAVKPSYIYELESGTKNPSARTLARMADAFGVDIRDLLPETRATSPSAMRLSMLKTTSELLITLLAERQARDAKLLTQETEITTQLNALLKLMKNAD